MKKMKKCAAVLLAMVMILSLAVTAFAANSGSIVINKADNVSVAGKTFKAYKILDLEMVETDGYVYTVPAELKNFYADYFKLSVDLGDFDYEVAQKIEAMQSNSDTLFTFAAAALAAAKTAGITPASATGATGATSVTLNNLPLGYYVIEDEGAATPISALMLDSTNPNVEINLKANQPTIEKKIDGDNDTDTTNSGLVDYNNAAIGDKVPYQLTSKVPDMTGYKKYYYVVTDTLSKGLTFNNDIKITIDGEELTKDTDYTVTVTKTDSGETKVEIVFKNFIQYKEKKGKDIIITYSATVNTDAVIGTAGNPNNVILTYSNNPNHDESGNTGDTPGPNSPVGQTPEDITRTYVTEIEILKVDTADKPLAGAEFTLTGTKLNTVIVETEIFTEDANGTYWKLKDGSYTTEDPATPEMDTSKYENTETKYKNETKTETIVKAENVTYKGTSGTNGIIRFTGLAAGEYTITEIKAPNGYNLLDKPIKVTIGWTAPTGTSTECTWTYTWTNENGDLVSATATNRVTVKNQTGSELPSTGGMGTTIFYLAGGLLVLVAVVLLVTKKRMSAER